MFRLAKLAVLPEIVLPLTVPFDVMLPLARIVVLEYIVSEVTAPFVVMLPADTLPLAVMLPDILALPVVDVPLASTT